jgi:uncharacterized protein YjiK
VKKRFEVHAVLWMTPLVLACAPAGSPAQVASPGIAAYDLEEGGVRFEMPGRLDEVSGLATTADGRLFGHNDERATVNEIDRETGVLGKRFSLGDPIIDGDFEGIAIAGERFFLITSQGLLYEFREADDRQTTPHRTTDTGLGATCEVEGLDYDARDDALLIACKVSAPDRGSIVVHRLPLDPARARPTPIEIPRSQLTGFGLDPEFQASSVAVSPTGTLFLASAAPEVLIEVDRAGRLLAAVELRGRRHPQSEGLAFGPDGALYIADERNNGPAGVLTRYERVQAQGEPR